MSTIEPGGIDCDIHPAVPNLKALFPYLTDHWRDIAIQRGMGELDSISYPVNAPLTCRPDWTRQAKNPAPISICYANTRWIRFAPASPSPIACTACNCCSARIWVRVSPVR